MIHRAPVIPAQRGPVGSPTKVGPDTGAGIQRHGNAVDSGVNEAVLSEITRRLVATYHPEQIVLFGSHAWGEPTRDSDVDLLVVVAESSEPTYRRASAGYRSLFGLGVPCDVWVRTREEVQREASLPTTLTHKILREGKVLHG
ncbi:MAG: nucleotidyltransferase domain-containing protein [Burkholderiaceae bacterium]